MSLLQMGIYGSILILFIAAIRSIAIHRLPKTVFFVLWEIAALRLLLPFSIPLPFSVLPVPAIGEEISAALPGLTGSDEGFVGAQEWNASVPLEQTQNDFHWLALLWGLGTVALTAWFLFSYVQNMRKFSVSLPDKTPMVQSWLAEHGGIRRLEVRVSDRIVSPLTYGILHPVILLPKRMDRRDEDTLRAVLTHEYVHVRRLDGVTKLLFAAALCVHWWNPFVWVMYVLANRDMELSCDAAVMRILGAEHRSAYALALISMEERRSGYASLQSYFSKNAISERIEAIMKFRRSSVAAVAAAAVLTVGGAVTAFAVEADTTPEIPKINMSEILGVKTVEDVPVGDFTTDENGNLPVGREIDLKDGWEVGKKTDGSAEPEKQNFPPLQVPDEFRESAERGEVKLVMPQEGATVSVFDADGNPVPVNAEGYNVYMSQDAAENMQYMNVLAVSCDDESKFTPEEWADILDKIDRGEIRWEE